MKMFVTLTPGGHERESLPLDAQRGSGKKYISMKGVVYFHQVLGAFAPKSGRKYTTA